jgi:integrase
VGDIKRSWTTACRAAGYPNAVFHDTRRAAVTNLANAGIPMHEIMAISGHRTRSMLDRYSIGTSEQKRRAFRRQTDYLEAERQKARPKVQPIR